MTNIRSAIKRKRHINSRLRIGFVSAAFLTVFGAACATQDTPTYATTPPDSCFAFTPSTGTITDYYDYEVNDSTNPACPRDVDIPNVIGEEAVVTIGTFAFGSKQLTSVTLPSFVTTIEQSAFYDNELSNLSIPNSVKTIGGTAFMENQLTTLNIPDSVTQIGIGAFSLNQLTSIVIPDSIEAIADNAFQENQLNEVVIPTSVTSIGAYAFQDNQLNEVVIPTLVTYIGRSAFQDNQLNSFIINSDLEQVGEGVLDNNPISSINYKGATYTIPAASNTIKEECLGVIDGVIAGYSDEADLLRAAVDGEVMCNPLQGDIVIPSSVGGEPITAIGQVAFAFNKIRSVHLSDSITSVDPMAFVAQGADDSVTDPSAIYYVRLYTNNPSITSSVFTNGTVNYGGHLVNPSPLTLNYRSSSNQDLRTSQTFTGMLNGSYLTDYLVANGPVITDSSDLSALSAYYSIGDEVTITPPAIEGYTTPPTQTFVLANADNEETYLYDAADSTGDDDDNATPATTNNGSNNAANSAVESELANTGESYTLALIAIAGSMLGAGVAYQLRKLLA